MQNYEVKITKLALKDIKTLSPKLKQKLKEILINTISIDPYIGKKLAGDLKGNYSFRLSFKDRIVYSIDENNKVVFLKRARTHYGQ